MRVAWLVLVACDGGAPSRSPLAPPPAPPVATEVPAEVPADAVLVDAPAIDAAPPIDAGIAIPEALQAAPAWIGRDLSVSDKAPAHHLTTYTLRFVGTDGVLEIDRRTRANRLRSDTAPFPEGTRTVQLVTLGTDALRCRRKKIAAAGANAGLKAIRQGEDCPGQARWVPARTTRVEVMQCDGSAARGPFLVAAAPGIEEVSIQDDCNIQDDGVRLIGADGALADPRAH